MATKNSNVNLSKVDELIYKRDEKIHKAKTECAQKALPILLKAFEKERTEGLSHIFVLGSTPEWNDGEDCVHRTTVFIENDRTNSKFTNVVEYFERFDDDMDYDNPPESVKAINCFLTHKEARDIENTFKKKYEDVLEEILGTNWKLEIEFLDNGEVKTTYGDYDCGY